MDSQEKTNSLTPELLTLHFRCFWSPFGPACLHFSFRGMIPAQNFEANLDRGTIKPLEIFPKNAKIIQQIYYKNTTLLFETNAKRRNVPVSLSMSGMQPPTGPPLSESGYLHAHGRTAVRTAVRLCVRPYGRTHGRTAV